MNIEIAKFLKEASENAGNECEIREGYSGRGMYGKETVGVVVDSEVQLLTDVIRFVSENISDFCDDNVNLKEWQGPEISNVSRFSIDNMGHRVILY